MENVTKVILLVASVLIAIAIVVIGLMFFNTASDTAKSANEDLAKFNEQFARMKFDDYDGGVVSGSQVVNAIRIYSDDMTVAVTTGAGTSTTYNETTKYTVSDSTAASYVNPTAKFSSALVVNSNDVVTGITFSQQ